MTDEQQETESGKEEIPQTENRYYNPLADGINVVMGTSSGLCVGGLIGIVGGFIAPTGIRGLKKYLDSEFPIKNTEISKFFNPAMIPAIFTGAVLMGAYALYAYGKDIAMGDSTVGWIAAGTNAASLLYEGLRIAYRKGHSKVMRKISV